MRGGSTTERRLGQVRQREVLRYVRQYGTGHVGDLAEALGVSESTVRRDLNRLHGRGLLERVHGGARVPDDDEEPLPTVRAAVNVAEKRRIGECAATLVAVGDTILLTGGTTTAALIPHLAVRTPLTVVTNGLDVAHQLAAVEGVDVVVLGGLLRRSEMSLLGHLTVRGAQDFGISAVFVGAYGVDPAIGLTGADVRETQTDRALVETAERLVVLADHSKLGRRGPARLAPVEAITTLVTGSAAPPDVLGAFSAHGVQVLTC